MSMAVLNLNTTIQLPKTQCVALLSQTANNAVIMGWMTAILVLIPA
jgi:hypothetical protein